MMMMLSKNAAAADVSHFPTFPLWNNTKITRCKIRDDLTLFGGGGEE